MKIMMEQESSTEGKLIQLAMTSQTHNEMVSILTLAYYSWIVSLFCNLVKDQKT